MTKHVRLGAVLIVLTALAAAAPVTRAQEAQATQDAGSSSPAFSVEILSDTGGVNTDAYLHDFLANLRKNWLTRLASVADSPSTHGEAAITVTIQPSGDLGAVRLDSSTQSDALTKAAWAAIQSVKPMPLPSGMKDPNLKIRIHFIVS